MKMLCTILGSRKRKNVKNIVEKEPTTKELVFETKLSKVKTKKGKKLNKGLVRIVSLLLAIFVIGFIITLIVNLILPEIINIAKLLVDNLFITNYLPEAPDNALKVYLYGLYLCQNSTISTVNEMANLLGMQVEEVKDFFKYWEEFGLLSIISYDPFTVTYYSTSSISTSYKRFKPEKYEDFTKAVQSVITGRMISVTEYNEYFQLLESTALKVEALLMICKYCVDLKGTEISLSDEELFILNKA